MHMAEAGAALLSLIMMTHVFLSRAVRLVDAEHSLLAASVGVNEERLPPTSTLAHLPADVLAAPHQPSATTTLSSAPSTGAVADVLSPTLAPVEHSSMPVSATILSSFPRPSTLPMSEEPAPPLPSPPMRTQTGDRDVIVRKPSEHTVERKTPPTTTSAHVITPRTPRRAGTTVMRGIQAASIMMHAPPLQSCHVGQRFILNHILHICHQFGPNRRGFRPFACTTRNEAESELVSRDTFRDEQHFRYVCKSGAKHSLAYQAVLCLLNGILIEPGSSLRKGRVEYSCMRDPSDGMLKLVETSFLHDYCTPGYNDDALTMADGARQRCPGTSTGVHYANFGNGTEAIFDTRRRQILLTR